MIVFLCTVMASLDYQNSMEHYSSVSMVTMEHCIQGLTIWLPVHTLTDVKKIEKTQIFLDQFCILFWKKKVLWFVQKQINPFVISILHINK